MQYSEIVSSVNGNAENKQEYQLNSGTHSNEYMTQMTVDRTQIQSKPEIESLKKISCQDEDVERVLQHYSYNLNN